MYQTPFGYSRIRQVDDPKSENVPDKSALSKLLIERIAISCHSPSKQRIIWARLAAAACQLPSLLGELEDLLFPYESVPREGIVQHGNSVEIPATAKEVISVLNTWAVIGCKFQPLGVQAR